MENSQRAMAWWSILSHDYRVLLMWKYSIKLNIIVRNPKFITGREIESIYDAEK